MATLYELTEQYQMLLDMASDEFTDPTALRDTMEGLSGEIEDKAENYAKVMEELNGRADTIDREVDRLKNRATVLRTNAAALKRNLEAAMIATGKTKFKTDLFSFGIQKNPKSLDTVDEANVPAEFWKPQEPKLDRTALLNFVKAEEKAGRKCAFATTKQTESLRIR